MCSVMTPFWSPVLEQDIRLCTIIINLEPQTPALGQKRDATWLVFLIETCATNLTRNISSAHGLTSVLLQQWVGRQNVSKIHSR
jgi:hypothetical protein